MLWAETPTNPLLRVADLAALAEASAAADAPMVVDNTTATSLLQRPLRQGRGRFAVLADQGDIRALRRDRRRRRRAGIYELLTGLRAWRSSGGGARAVRGLAGAARLKTLPLWIAPVDAPCGSRVPGGHSRVSTIPLTPRSRHAGLAERGATASAPCCPSRSRRARRAAGRWSAPRMIPAATARPHGVHLGAPRQRGRAPTAPAGLIRLSVGVEPAADLIADIDGALRTLEAPQGPRSGSHWPRGPHWRCRDAQGRRRLRDRRRPRAGSTPGPRWRS